MKGVIELKIELDGKSTLVGIIIGWLGTVFMATLSVAKDQVRRNKEEEA